MEGKVKWFSKEKGFGFITENDGGDRFFGVTDIKGADLPNNGDTVTFEPMEGKKGPKATNVTITQKATQVSNAPYYGKATYRTETSFSGVGGVGDTLSGAAVGTIIAGPIGGIVGGILGLFCGGEKVEQEIEITSPCLKCGGTGQVTSRVDGKIGFQCKTCRKYWTKRDEYL